MSPVPNSARQNPRADEAVASADGSHTGLSHQMLGLLERADGKGIDLRTVFAVLSGRSHWILIVFLSFPLCLPLGIPVITTSLGLALGLVGFLLASGRDIWIPESIATKVIPFKRLSYIVERLLWFLARFERWFRPRIAFLATNSRMARVHGFFVMMLGLIAAFPIPLPLNNFVAALPILLLGLSLLQRDGVLVIVSYLSAIPCFIYYGALVYFGHAGLAWIARLLNF